ncbi:2-isopropylmalate synthase [Xanthomonas translucens]|uniref:2-isopropylmalate synthase n=1 Tax=Xanthomonas campestris pv. translucens TaxID=343 RepID=UPI00071E99B4|nr:2-isopropylmalate synthase [Xanthomonas translucens]KWV15614.1 2-isopropylmalate synthase [Xanthomonas translucens]MCS3360594.1 2-isopropylmalate synthase [Xanthomonas translucens pv. translucens]MCS3374393.1 2-isopropylmalate synthase [Xanthomonas translucens pv. translucens]MCT8274313.1 2-isopropylmalate synthase [Xanthomonas translucens pv. translucens]MCT8278223.1 2-isopropylmalate synthase [Xanthomonas translucens pv. translucens]
MNTSASSQTPRIRIFDTTLRDGEQSPGCSMTPQQKLVMARALAELGADIIETGFPASSQSDREAMAMIGRELREPTLAVLSRCLASDIETSARALEAAARPRLHVFLSTSPLHREHKLRMSREQVLESIRKHVSLARQYVDDVEFSAEDATRTEEDFLAEVTAVAIAAGATTINLPDTVGFTTPEEIHGMFARLIASVPGAERVIFSTHCHNDLGLAVANSLAAVEAGARQVECAINGIGERAGNCALEEITMALKVRGAFYGIDTAINTQRIVASSQLLQRLVGMPVQRNKAIVGGNAFAHESGIHQHGMLRHRSTYEIMRPEDVGWESSQMVLGRHSGRAAVEQRLRALGYVLEEAELILAFETFKALCEQQRVVSDSDLQAMMQDAPESQGYRLSSMTVSDRGQRASAQVELSDPDGQRVSEHAEGDGPVDALFAALAAATGVQLTLDSYQVHSVGIGADARGEANLSVRHGETEYDGTGTSRDIIEASALAWLDVANRVLRQRQGAQTGATSAAA